MAKSSNTWCKKLMAKRKQQIIKQVFGGYKPLMGSKPPALKATVTRKGNVVELKIPTRDLPNENREVKVIKVREFNAPMKDGWKPRQWKKYA